MMNSLKNVVGFWVLVNTYARMKLKSEALKTYLSYLWWLLEPALFVAAFYYVFAVVLEFQTTDFVVFLVLGKIPYLWFAKCMGGGAGSVFAGRDLLTHAAIRPELFPMVDFFQNMYKQMVAFTAVLLFLLLQGHMPTAHWLLLPVIALAQMAFMMPLVLAAAWITAFIPDVRMLIDVFVLIMMFVSGIFWNINDLQSPMREQMLLWNPLAFLIDAYRQVLLHQSQPDWTHLIVLVTISLAISAVLFVLYRRTKDFISTRVLYS